MAATPQHQQQRAAVESRLQAAGFTVSEPEALDLFVSLAHEYGLAPATVADDYEIMSSLKENCNMEVSQSTVSTKAFRDFLAKQHPNKTQTTSGKRGAAGVGAKPSLFGSSGWDSLSEREAALYQPTPKRQAVATSTPGGGLKGAAPPLARTPLTARTPHLPAGKLGGGGASALRLAGPAAGPGAMDVDGLPSGAGRLAGGAGALQPRQGTPSEAAAKFASRTGKGEVVLSLHDHLPEWSGASSRGGAPAVQLAGEALPPAGQHLFMTETLEGKVQAVEDRLQEWCDHLAAAVPEAREAAQQPVQQITQEPVWCVGRVVVDAGGEEGGVGGGRLGVGNLALEGSRLASEGARVRLDVSALPPGARFFPGQVVAVRGVNPTGAALVAQSVCASLPAPAPAGEPGATCVLVAAGPFTTADELCYEPLEQLLHHCDAHRAEVLVLVGPFVDAQHSAVQSGLLDQTVEEVFQEQVLQRLADWQARSAAASSRKGGPHAPATRVVLVPSARDAHHAPVHPTPAFAIPSGLATLGVQSFQSPCALSVAGSGAAAPDAAPAGSEEGGRAGDGAPAAPLVVGVTSADVMKALSGSELAVGAGPGGDRITALASHVPGQRSFFPVCPPPLGACLDLSYQPALQLHATPHVLVLPSDLAPFAKLLRLPRRPRAAAQPPAPAGAAPSPQAADGEGEGEVEVVCINPGRLVRGTTGGTFALVTVSAPAAPAAGTEAGGAGWARRCRVELRRV